MAGRARVNALQTPAPVQTSSVAVAHVRTACAESPGRASVRISTHRSRPGPAMSMTHVRTSQRAQSRAESDRHWSSLTSIYAFKQITTRVHTALAIKRKRNSLNVKRKRNIVSRVQAHAAGWASTRRVTDTGHSRDMSRDTAFLVHRDTAEGHVDVPLPTCLRFLDEALYSSSVFRPHACNVSRQLSKSVVSCETTHVYRTAFALRAAYAFAFT